MPRPESENPEKVRIPVRKGRYSYVLVRTDGTSTTIPVPVSAYDAGAVEVAVRPGERVVEIALSSTSDPDLDPPRGELWPGEAA